MKKIFYLYSKSLLSKLALIAILIVGGGSSAWAQKSLPYTYGFENNNLATDGWTMYNNNTTSSVKTGIFYANTAYTHTGLYHFRFISYSSAPQYLISPELASSDTGIEVSFYYRTYGSTDNETFNVGYSTSDNSIGSFTWGGEVSLSSSTYTLYENTFPTGVKYIAIKATTNSDNTYRYLFIDDINIESNNPYKTPTDFTLNSFTETSATFSWTAGNSETNWKFAYSTDPDFTPSTSTATSITENPYTLSGLTEGITYYACICADYGDDKYSDWTEKIEFIPSNNVVETINDGTSSLYNFPIYYGGVAPSSGELYKSQFIIPKGSLDFAKGRQINKLVFYASNASMSFGNAEFEVYLKETDNGSFSSNAFESWGTCVANSAKFSVNSDKEMIVELNTPFNYSGNKNLMIGFKQTIKGTNASSFTWTGVSATNAGYYYYGTYGNRYSYLPKLTITTVPITSAPVKIDLNGYTTFASPYPLDLTNLPSGLKAYKAAVDAENSRVIFTEINQTVPANTGMLLEGIAGQTYAIPVAASGTAPEGNAFLVNSTGGTFSAESGYTYYGMKKATSAKDPIVFATFAPGSVAIPSNKAYLKVENAPSGASRQLVCAFNDNTTTTIAEISDKQNGQNKYFNLAGQRVDGSRFTVNGAGLKPGLYIINGKKVVIK